MQITNGRSARKDDNEVHNAITILCNKNKIEKIKDSVRYLKGILENLKNNSNKVYNKESDNTKNLKFNNFESRHMTMRNQKENYLDGISNLSSFIKQDSID